MNQSAQQDPWRMALLPSSATIHEAIQSLDRSGMQIVLVVSDQDRLFGTLTDGDIRRALLKGLTLQSPADQIAHQNPLVVPPEMGREMVVQLMLANRIHQLPVVDRDRKVVGLHIWDEILAPSTRPNLMVVMAGGRGTRLRPHTEHCPKPMLEVGNKPILEHIIERAKSEGFCEFILAIHYLGSQIEDYFGDGNQWGVSVGYLREKSPLGTAGALSLLSMRPEVPFLVTNGDVMTDVHYGEMLEFHGRHQAAATMAVRQHELQNPFGVVRTNGVDIVGFEEKPVYRNHINAGIYVLSPAGLDVLLPGQYCEMPTLFDRIRERSGRTIVFPMHEPWLDVGRPDDLELARDPQG